MTTTTNISETIDRESLIDLYWDMYKEAYNVRPRHVDFNSMTMEQMTKDIEYFESVVQENYKQRLIDEAHAIEQFEIRVAAVIATGAGTREDAIRWIHEAEDTQGDDDYLCYNLGLPYGYFARKTVE